MAYCDAMPAMGNLRWVRTNGMAFVTCLTIILSPKLSAVIPVQFGDATYVAVSGNPVAIATGDFNGDGNPDIATVNHYCNSLSILWRLRDGSFPSQTNYAVGWYPQGIAVGDLNNDGRSDIVLSGNTNFTVLLGNSAARLLATNSAAYTSYYD